MTLGCYGCAPWRPSREEHVVYTRTAKGSLEDALAWIRNNHLNPAVLEELQAELPAGDRVTLLIPTSIDLWRGEDILIINVEELLPSHVAIAADANWESVIEATSRDTWVLQGQVAVELAKFCC